MKRHPLIRKILDCKVFGFVIGGAVFLLISFLNYNPWFPTFRFLDQKMTDIYFAYRDLFVPERQGEGVTIQQRSSQVSPNILILGIDERSLETLGKWPFPRYVYGDLARALARIQDQSQRENSLLLDVFFVEPDRDAVSDGLLRDGIKENGRVFLETTLEKTEKNLQDPEEYQQRHRVLFEKYGEITNVSGPWEKMIGYPGLQPPLQPLGREVKGYGNAIFEADSDEVFRRAPLIAKSMELLEEIPFQDLQPDLSGYEKDFVRYVWEDKTGAYQTVPSPLSAEVLQRLALQLEAEGIKKSEDTDGDGTIDREYFLIKKYKDHFIPAISLSLALNWFHKDLSNPEDVEVVIGSHILIKNPMHLDLTSGKIVPYTRTIVEAQFDTDGTIINPARFEEVKEIRIPIDENGQMVINYMGKRSSDKADEYQTFPVRSFSTYATRRPGEDPATWLKTLKLENKILLAGAFATGIADDEKPTPMGLMYGVEIHANALNTILMQKFINPVPMHWNLVILGVLLVFVVLLATRMSTILAFFLTFLGIFLHFGAASTLFDYLAVDMPFVSTAVAMVLTFIAIVVYRVMTEERSKQKLQRTFGKFVHPAIVNQMMENPPELGGVDKELTVLFSDIRGFTTLSESMSPQELVNHLNIYLTAMTDIIMEYRGTLDKYVGDEVMCFWGAPLEQRDHAVLACKCALKQMQVLRALNEKWPSNRRIDIGIGLNSGIMTVGMMGSSGRMNYTLMGDNVNLGARLEGTNKAYGTNVIISEYTYSLVKETAIVRELDNIRVKGKNKPVLIYELLDFTDGIEPPKLAVKK